MPGIRKYPWDALAKVGDTLIVEESPGTIRGAADAWKKRNNVKLRIHKIKGGSLVVRVG